MGSAVRIRRARRGDFAAVREVLEASGAVSPSEERADLRRFRRIVADLGGDFYVALTPDQVIGFVHVSYVRQIATQGRARIEALVVAPEWRERGVVSSLIDHATARARRRGCAEIVWTGPADPEIPALLGTRGWQPSGETLRVDLKGSDQ